MSIAEPSCIQQFRKICYKKSPTVVNGDTALFELLMSAATEQRSRMAVVAQAHLIHFRKELFNVATAYFAPGDDGYAHFLPASFNPKSLSYVKNGNRLICKYAGSQRYLNMNASVWIYFTCAGIHQLEKKAFDSAARKPKGQRSKAIHRAL